MDLGKHVIDITLDYSTWRTNWVKDLVLHPIDDMVQPASLLPERVLTESEILRSKIEAERKETNFKILTLQEDLGNVIMTRSSSKRKFVKRIKSMTFYWKTSKS